MTDRTLAHDGAVFSQSIPMYHDAVAAAAAATVSCDRGANPPSRSGWVCACHSCRMTSASDTRQRSAFVIPFEVVRIDGCVQIGDVKVLVWQGR